MESVKSELIDNNHCNLRKMKAVQDFYINCCLKKSGGIKCH
jgi:hypothetical protein